MPGKWAEWEKAKRELKETPARQAAAVRDALDILKSGQRQAKKASQTGLRCQACGGTGFKTRRKGEEWECRTCGWVTTKRV